MEGQFPFPQAIILAVLIASAVGSTAFGWVKVLAGYDGRTPFIVGLASTIFGLLLYIGGFWS